MVNLSRRFDLLHLDLLTFFSNLCKDCQRAIACHSVVYPISNSTSSILAYLPVEVKYNAPLLYGPADAINLAALGLCCAQVCHRPGPLRNLHCCHRSWPRVNPICVDWSNFFVANHKNKLWSPKLSYNDDVWTKKRPTFFPNSINAGSKFSDHQFSPVNGWNLNKLTTLRSNLVNRSHQMEGRPNSTVKI